jgi:hypothetical protein
LQYYCSSAILIEYSNGSIPGLPRLSSTSPRCNGVALTSCRNCFTRTKKGLEELARDNRGQFRMSRTSSIRPDPWDTSDLTKAAALVLKETVGLMLVGRVCLRLSWDRVSRPTTARDRVTSLDVSQAATGDAQKVVFCRISLAIGPECSGLHLHGEVLLAYVRRLLGEFHVYIGNILMVLEARGKQRCSARWLKPFM